ncbi:MAG: hypothetical protein GX226_04320 [Dehalococcoidales bacterium]|nr:hypothetical protein [Dehalococcoidales bacterium]
MIKTPYLPIFSIIVRGSGSLGRFDGLLAGGFNEKIILGIRTNRVIISEKG